MKLLPKKVFTPLYRGFGNWEEVLRLADVHLLSICVLHDMDALAMLSERGPTLELLYLQLSNKSRLQKCF